MVMNEQDLAYWQALKEKHLTELNTLQGKITTVISQYETAMTEETAAIERIDKVLENAEVISEEPAPPQE